MSWQLDKIGFGGDGWGGQKKLKKPSEHALNGMFPKGPPTHGHPCPNMLHQKMLAVPVFQWRASCCLVLGGWDGDNSLATSDYVCSSMEMHPSQYDQQTPPSSPYYVLPPITATLDIWGRSSVWLCYLQQSNAWQQRSCPCSGRDEDQATAQVLDYSQPNPAWTTSNYYSFDMHCFHLTVLHYSWNGFTTFCKPKNYVVFSSCQEMLMYDFAFVNQGHFRIYNS